MTNATDLLPLRDIIRPKPERPNLVENINEALANPVRTLRDYLFTNGIRGYFDRIFRDVQENRGGGYWVQAEYGGGKTHFLSTLLCLLTETDGNAGDEVWQAVGDSGLREMWERTVRPRRLLGAHLSLMGTATRVGEKQPQLLGLIDTAIIEALARRGLSDPGLRASSEVFDTYSRLNAAIRSVLDAEFSARHGLSVQSHRDEFADDSKTAAMLVELAEGLQIDLLQHRQVQDHARHLLRQLNALKFDGLVLVIDEYLSRESGLDDAQKNEDAATLETLGFKLGREEKLPIYVVVASQGALPAKLQERFDPVALLRDADKEYSEIVCKRVMDYDPRVEEQAVLYHAHFARSFQFLRRSSERDTREIFPFQAAVFRYLRDLVGSSRMNIPSARFAIGVAYDTIARSGALDVTRFITTSDLMSGSLENDLLAAPEMKDAAAALRQARDVIDDLEWDLPYLQPMAHNILNHLFLDSVVREQGQTLDQVVEGTLVEAPAATLPSKDIARAVLKKLKDACQQIDEKEGKYRFASRMSEGEPFEPLFARERRGVQPTDPLVMEKWVELLTAPLQMTAGIVPFLSPVVAGLRLETEYGGLQFPGRVVYAPGNLAIHLAPLARLTQPERVRIVVVPKTMEPPPLITDPAIALVIPSDPPESAIDDLRGLLACQEIIREYGARIEPGAERVKEAAERKSVELTRTIIGRQREVYRDGEILTKDGIPLNAKQFFKDSVKAGAGLIAEQLVRHAYGSLSAILNVPLAKRSALATADTQKVFDGIFGHITEQKTKGAAEAYGPLLGLSTPKAPADLVANAGPGPEAVASFINERLSEPMYMAEVYERFCNDPYGLSANVVDLLVYACVALSSPAALELRPPPGAAIETRDRRPFQGPLRASQLGNISWPKDGLKGCQIVQSNEATWNDFAPIAQAIDPQRFVLTTDQQEIQRQQQTFVDRLGELKKQCDDTRRAIQALADASGTKPQAQHLAALDRMQTFATLQDDFSREIAIKLVSETWGAGNYQGIKTDVQELTSLSQLIGEAPKLAGQLSWFRALAAVAPDGLKSEIAAAAPQLSLDQITAGSRQISAARSAADELHAIFMARYREEHKKYAAWLDEQSAQLTQAANKLPTLARLNAIGQLGQADLPAAAIDVSRRQAQLAPCPTCDNPDVGAGITCLKCSYTLGTLESLLPAGRDTERAIAAAIEQRTRALSQGLIADTLSSVGDKDIAALLEAGRAGHFEQITEDGLLSDDLVRRINSALEKAKQQTVPSARVYSFIRRRPTVTPTTVEAWLSELRAEIIAGLEAAKRDNPGKEVTLLLKDGDAD